jgi:hypothetical protein
LPRSRKLDSSAAVADKHAKGAGFEPPFVAGSPPPQMRAPSSTPMSGDKFNVEWFAESLALLNRFQVDYWNWWGRAWPEYREQIQTLMAMAEACGVDLQRYAPETLSITDLSRIDDALSLSDEQISAMIRQINDSAATALRMLPDVKKKSWLSSLARIRAMQEICRDPIPRAAIKAGLDDALLEAWELTHPLRFMLYCWRSDLNQSGGQKVLPDTPDHIVEACLTVELAQRARDQRHDVKGAIVTIPPRHGKTSFVQARRALRISRNPWSPFGIVHANDEIAADRVAGVKEWFDDDHPTGRRRAALYPRVRLHLRRSKAKDTIVVTLDGEIVCSAKEGNYRGHGVHASVQGITLHEIDFDDPVEERERRERGSRERTNAAFHQTWLSRLTGKTSFFTLISTCWHPDDVTGGLTKMARSGAMNVAMCNLPCGGAPDFKPLWPGAGYDSAFLRGKFRTLTPPVYACIYQNNPDDISGRKISRLHYYPSRMWTHPDERDEAWSQFFSDPATLFYLSLDPSGSSNVNSNRAGMLYSAFGRLLRYRPDGIGVRVPTLVFLRCWSLTLSQHGLADEVLAFVGTGAKVDRVLVETTSGFHATAEELVRRGIPANKVLSLVPGTGTKVSRLLRYALYIEAGDAMFPGEPTADEGGNAVLSYGTDWERTVDQLLLAGMSDDDEMIDVIRQQLGEVAHELVAAHGWDKLDKALPAKADAQVRALDKFYRSLTKARQERPRRTPGSAFGSFSTSRVLNAN